MTIKDWFNMGGHKEKDFIKTFTDKVCNHVKLIVNTPTGNEKELFAGINGIRVPLDGADLMRAILITRAAKERFGNCSDAHIDEFRIRMAMEIDGMSTWWSESAVQKFFTQLLSENAKKNDKHGLVRFDNKNGINLLYRICS